MKIKSFAIIISCFIAIALLAETINGPLTVNGIITGNASGLYGIVNCTVIGNVAVNTVLGSNGVSSASTFSSTASGTNFLNTGPNSFVWIETASNLAFFDSSGNLIVGPFTISSTFPIPYPIQMNGYLTNSSMTSAPLHAE